jgi:hypothetical protein
MAAPDAGMAHRRLRTAPTPAAASRSTRSCASPHRRHRVTASSGPNGGRRLDALGGAAGVAGRIGRRLRLGGLHHVLDDGRVQLAVGHPYRSSSIRTTWQRRPVCRACATAASIAPIIVAISAKRRCGGGDGGQWPRRRRRNRQRGARRSSAWRGSWASGKPRSKRNRRLPPVEHGRGHEGLHGVAAADLQGHHGAERPAEVLLPHGDGGGCGDGLLGRATFAGGPGGRGDRGGAGPGVSHGCGDLKGVGQCITAFCDADRLSSPFSWP